MEKEREVYIKYDRHIEEAIDRVSSMDEVVLEGSYYSLKRRIIDSSFPVTASLVSTIMFETERKTGLSKEIVSQYALSIGVTASLLASGVITLERIRKRFKNSKYSPNESYLVESNSLIASKFGIIPKTDINTASLAQKILVHESIPDENYFYNTNILEEEKYIPYNISSIEFVDIVNEYISEIEDLPEDLILFIQMSRNLFDYSLTKNEFIKKIFLYIKKNLDDTSIHNKDLIESAKTIFSNLSFLYYLGEKNNLERIIKSDDDKSLGFDKDLEEILLLNLEKKYTFKKYIDNFLDIKLDDYNLLDKINTLSKEDLSEIKTYSWGVYLIVKRLMNIQGYPNDDDDVYLFHKFLYKTILKNHFYNKKNGKDILYEYYLTQNIYDLVKSDPDNLSKDKIKSRIMILSESKLLEQLNLYLSQFINFSPEYRYPLDKHIYMINEDTLKDVLNIILFRKFSIIEHNNKFKNRFLTKDGIDNNKLKFALKVLKDYARFSKKEYPDLFKGLKDEVIKEGIKDNRRKILKSEEFYLFSNSALGIIAALAPIIIK